MIWFGVAFKLYKTDACKLDSGQKKTGKSESDVIKIMRRNLKPSSFRLWRERAKRKSIKHRKKFILERKNLRKKINKTKFI